MWNEVGIVSAGCTNSYSGEMSGTQKVFLKQKVTYLISRKSNFISIIRSEIHND